MTARDTVLTRFSGDGSPPPVFLPNLSIWFAWNSQRGSLPAEWRGTTPDVMYRALGIPVRRLVRPWRFESSYEIAESRTSSEKSIQITTDTRVLTARWTLGPDGDWWQTEYLAKNREDLQAVRALVDKRRFVAEPDVVTTAKSEVGDDGVVLVDLPARPFSWLMLEALGFSEGIMLLLDAEDIVREIVDTAERQIQDLTSELAGSALLFYSPDNLDAQFVSPGFFEDYLASSYRETVRRLNADDGKLIVHAGGLIGALLPAIASTGVAAVEGICGPPQSDASLQTARGLTGAQITLVGGIPQDHLIPDTDEAALLQSIEDATESASVDAGVIISVADHVPNGASAERIRLVASRFAGEWPMTHR